MKKEKKQWTKKCPNPKNNSNCKKTIKCKTSKLCTSCSAYKRKIMWKDKLSEIRIKNELSKGKNNPMYGKHFTKMWKETYGEEKADKMIKELYSNRKDISGKNNGMHGKSLKDVWIEKYGKNKAKQLEKNRIAKMKKTMSCDEYREKNILTQKIIRLNKIIEDGVFQWPSYNKRACNIIEKYGKKNGYNFQHALNGGEKRILCYWVDGYDKNKNVVIEYYEKKHDKKIEYDNERMNRIIKFLKCKFIILKETKKGLEELIYA